MTIRSADASDGPAIVGLWSELQSEQHEIDQRFSASEDAAERWLNDFREWVKAPDVCRIVVAELDGESGSKLVGFASAHLWWPPPVYEQVLEVYLDEVYVRPANRRQGFGSKLLDDVQEWARGKDVAQIRLSTLAANQEAIGFWKNRGVSEFLVTMLLPTVG